MKISLTSIHVTDPIKAHAFYTDVLGFVSKMFIPEAQLAIVVSPEEPNGTAMMLEPNSNPIAKNYQEGLYAEGIPAIVFGVEDIQKEYDRLRASGVNFKSAPEKTDWGTQAVFDDTCGNYVQMHQML